eukprot:Gb_22599 [translate_table: standard]
MVRRLEIISDEEADLQVGEDFMLHLQMWRDTSRGGGAPNPAQHDIHRGVIGRQPKPKPTEVTTAAFNSTHCRLGRGRGCPGDGDDENAESGAPTALQSLETILLPPPVIAVAIAIAILILLFHVALS